MAATSTPTQNLVNSLRAELKGEFTEVKNLLSGMDDRLRTLETREAGCQPVITARMDATVRRIDDHDVKLRCQGEVMDQLAKVVTRLEENGKVTRWLLTAVGGAVLVWLVTQILSLV